MAHKIIVAGGSGFIGAYVVSELIEIGHDVTVADNAAPHDSLKQNPSVKFLKMDLRKTESARDALAGCDVCILLAARSAGIGYFNKHPAEM